MKIVKKTHLLNEWNLQDLNTILILMNALALHPCLFLNIQGNVISACINSCICL